MFDAALRGADGHDSVERALRDLAPGPVALFAIGKAASSMTRGACSALGDHVQQALLITKYGHVEPMASRLPRVHAMQSAHPVPDERSLAAGAELQRRVTELPGGIHPVFLVSGGSSSLVESLQPGVSLDDLRALNMRGLSAGWDIGRLNAERRALSRLKGGGVARLLAGRPAHALFISDVPGDDPDVIGSGLLGAADGIVDRVSRIIVANIEAATRSALDMAGARGLEMELRGQRFAGDAVDVAAEFLEALRTTAADGLIWGGESTVSLPERAGRGGRNQHLALCAARELRPNEPLTILAAGTDGTDGPTDDAGAIVDAGTVTRAELAGVDVERAWREFDSGLALEAAEDLVHTGPTGTNVGDILIGIKQNRARVRDPASSRMV